MINRTLIRMKVVQLLYAHLLRRSDFNIISHPQRETKEAVDSFTIYAQSMALIMLATGQSVAITAFPSLRGTAIEKAVKTRGSIINELARDNYLKILFSSGSIDLESLKILLPRFIEAVNKSTVYNDFKKKKEISVEDEIKFWTTLTSSVLLKVITHYNEESNKDYSEYAIKKAIGDINESLTSFAGLRIAFLEAQAALETALDNAYTLYIALLALAVNIVDERAQQLDNAKNKYLPSPDDLNPDTRFIDSPLVKDIRENESIRKHLEKNPVYWDIEPRFIKSLLTDIMSSDIYKEYMEKESITTADDCVFWQKVFQKIILPSDALAEVMESKNIYWNDDLLIMGSFVVKTLARAAEKDAQIDVMPMYKDDEDRQFGPQLFMHAFRNYSKYRELIDIFVSDNWDPERIAFMDIVIMVAAVAELINFPLIPLPVTMNQYTDIAADYSTPRSGQFVNGLLYSLSQQLIKEGKIFK